MKIEIINTKGNIILNEEKKNKIIYLYQKKYKKQHI